MAQSLNTEIQNIVNSNKAYSTKRRELAQLGLRPFEINLRLPHEASQPRFTFKFGIELETVCPSFDVAALALTAIGIGVSHNHSYHHTNNNVDFELKRDGSIRTRNYSEAGVEVVSGVLAGGKTAYDTIKKATNAIKDCGGYVNRSTGYHVHISTPGMNDEWFSNVFANYAHAERVIDTFMAESRRGNNNTYCKSIRPCISSLDSCHSIESVNNVLCSRYFKVNPQAYRMHKTIEFRQHQGTLNAEKVVKWVEFCSALIAWSKSHRLDHDITSVSDMAWLSGSLKTYFSGRVAEFAA